MTSSVLRVCIASSALASHEPAVGQAPGGVADVAEVLEPEVAAAVAGAHLGAPVLVVLDPAHPHFRVVNVDPLVREERLPAHHEPDQDERSVPQ
jgi:hypothetical protein